MRRGALHTRFVTGRAHPTPVVVAVDALPEHLGACRILIVAACSGTERRDRADPSKNLGHACSTRPLRPGFGGLSRPATFRRVFHACMWVGSRPTPAAPSRRARPLAHRPL